MAKVVLLKIPSDFVEAVSAMGGEFGCSSEGETEMHR